MPIFKKDFKLGLLGGGQLGRMLLQAAIDLDVFVKVLEPDADAPCQYLANEFVVGSLLDYDTVYNFGKDCEVITIEIENVNISALEALEKDGKKVYPQTSVLKIIQDKRIQKQFYIENNIPTADFILTENLSEIEQNIDFLPAFNKIGKGGYDGRGVQKLKTFADLPLAFTEPSLLEKAIDFEKEIAIIVARNEAGEIKTFPTVEMVFHETHNLVDYLFAPAQISDIINNKAEKIAKDVAKKLGIIGVLAVEMFLTKSGEILVNEVAPRAHNSGHHTIRGNYCSQYEQHLRAVLGLPLAATEAHCSAAMVNIIGEKGYEGLAKYEGLEEVLKLEGVYPFLYGKKYTKPARKMGHVTVIGKDLKTLNEKIGIIKSKLFVKA